MGFSEVSAPLTAEAQALGARIFWGQFRVQAVFGINFLRFDARSRLCAPRLGTGFAATVSRTPSPRMVEGPINSFHRQVARRPRNAETTESTADEP